ETRRDETRRDETRRDETIRPDATWTGFRGANLMSGDRLNAPSFEISTGAGSLIEARFIPQRYEPNYAYPLLVLFHARGGDEQQMVRSLPALSWRNYVGLSIRGPEPWHRRGRAEGYGWGPSFARPDRVVPPPAPTLSEAETVRR